MLIEYEIISAQQRIQMSMYVLTYAPMCVCVCVRKSEYMFYA